MCYSSKCETLTAINYYTAKDFWTLALNFYLQMYIISIFVYAVFNGFPFLTFKEIDEKAKHYGRRTDTYKVCLKGMFMLTVDIKFTIYFCRIRPKKKMSRFRKPYRPYFFWAYPKLFLRHLRSFLYFLGYFE